MKGYLLDTNICIFYMKGRYQLDEKIAKVGQNNCYISEITVAELLFGAARSANKEKHLKQIASFIGQFKILPIYNALSVFADKKAELYAKGQPIDDFDILIDATAIYHKLVMITENVKHLNHLSSIKIENWIER
ncbi:type II toxin-antitoxin system VapC family toxin [Bacteroides stercorirosoris]|jgi:tRNA(fMet)-specific endonuclease VapC|uniref:Type II toxin-antitoxin system VapC family toxin n=1 Tax=Bacteroides stercorirosoris TaxID=871324 RepID=A0A413H6V1_9BACE|nr:type II toxin-antitoxin system VapC family toxin [Bacteroides stercorirosoris]OKZ13576.1 MAG: VapC toxin family PIN domain ribonuclease [Bacteroides oleiciplenus]RGX79159.1 type II toxin-antitoxin system VapC family toxin [Bacteroides stercorirosoris]